MKKSQPNSPDAAPPHAETRRASGGLWVPTGLLMGLETLALMGMAGMVFVELFSGSASTTSRAVTEGICLLLLAVGTGLLAFYLLRRRSLAKTPTLLWNGMLVPVGFNLVGGGAPAVGYAVLVVAVLTFLLTLTLPRYDLEDDEPAA